MPDGVTAQVTFDGVDISVNGTAYVCAFKIEDAGTADLILTGQNTLKSGENRAGLEVSNGAKVTCSNQVVSNKTLTMTKGKPIH